MCVPVLWFHIWYLICFGSGKAFKKSWLSQTKLPQSTDKRPCSNFHAFCKPQYLYFVSFFITAPFLRSFPRGGRWEKILPPEFQSRERHLPGLGSIIVSREPGQRPMSFAVFNWNKSVACHIWLFTNFCQLVLVVVIDKVWVMEMWLPTTSLVLSRNHGVENMMIFREQNPCLRILHFQYMSFKLSLSPSHTLNTTKKCNMISLVWLWQWLYTLRIFSLIYLWICCIKKSYLLLPKLLELIEK